MDESESEHRDAVWWGCERENEKQFICKSGDEVKREKFMPKVRGVLEWETWTGRTGRTV